MLHLPKIQIKHPIKLNMSTKIKKGRN